MVSYYFQVFLIAACVIYNLTAAVAARKPHPSHPLVENRCPPAAWPFGIASCCYLVATTLLLLKYSWWGAGIALAGLVSSGVGYAWAKQPELTFRQLFALH